MRLVPHLSSLVRPKLLLAIVGASLAAAILVAPDSGRTVEAVGGVTLGAGGEFHAVEPFRVLDTRDASAGSLAGVRTTGPLSSAPEIVVPISGRGDIPNFGDADRNGFDDDVLAVVVNITVVEPTRPGYLTAFGTGTPSPARETSVVNFRSGDVVPNTAIIRLGVGGSLSMRLVTPSGIGGSHVVVDVSGWFSSSEHDVRGARTVAVPPARIFDSHEPRFAPVPSGRAWQRTIPIHGAVDMYDSTRRVIPDDPDVVGVIVNLTGDRPSAATYVSLLGDPVASEDDVSTSNLNLVAGQTRANLAIVPVPDDGDLTLFNLRGDVRLIIDVVGYLLAGVDERSTAGRVVPLVAPFRVFDTREAEFGSQRLPARYAEDWNFDDFVADVRIDGRWVGEQRGLFGNLTATGLTRQSPSFPAAKSYLTAFPSPANGARPGASTLNVVEGDSVPNLVLLSYGPTEYQDDAFDPPVPVPVDHGVAVFNWSGFVHYLLDVYAVVLD